MVQFVTNKNPFSAYTTALIESRFIPVIEDIQTSYSRIFIDKQAYDVNTLTLQANTTNWHFNNRDSHTPVNLQATSIYGALYLMNGSVSTFCGTENSITGGSYGNRAAYNVYHTYLDDAAPARQMIKLASNNIFYSIHVPFVGTTQTYSALANNIGHVYGPDITQPPINTSGSVGVVTTTTFGNFGNILLYEDATNGFLWSMGFAANSTVSGYQVYATNNYLTSTAPTVAAVINNQGAGEFAYLGRDTAGNPYFVTTVHNTANDPINVFYANQTSRATTNILTSQVPATSTTQTYNMTFPSNLRTDSSTRKVFYTMHWDSSNNLAPLQFIWNPSAVGSVTKVNCTVSYPGTNTYNNFARQYLNTSSGVTLANTIYFGKPYQFTIGTNNYITFTSSDLGAGVITNSSTRFANTLSRAWVTYSIGNTATSNDNVLTYHSSFTSNSIFDHSHNWMPVPGTNGNTLAIATSASINFMQFDTTNGWTLKSQYKGTATGFGFDQTNRMWAWMLDNYRGSPGSAGSIHIITPTSNTPAPTNIGIVFANNNLVYTGANISTTAALNAYDYANNRIEANVTLTIDGGSMVFNDNTKQKTFTTSNSADTTVSLIITSGGQSTIIPSVNI